VPPDRVAARRWLKMAAAARIAPAKALLTRIADAPPAGGCADSQENTPWHGAQRFHAVLTTRGMMAQTFLSSC